MRLKFGLGLAVALAAQLCTASVQAQDKLVLWWNKSFVPDQDRVMEDIVKAWEKKSGKSAELTFYALPDLPARMVAAFDAKQVPDVVFGQIVAIQTAAFAFEDKLLDIGDVIKPLSPGFTEGARNALTYLNGKTGERAVYAFPIMQHGVNLHYWQDLVDKADMPSKTPPTDWAGFWNYWGAVQKSLRSKGERVFGTGLTYSVESTDTWQELVYFQNAYGVRFVDQTGKLLVDEPATRAGMIKALDDFARHYMARDVPTGAINWKDSDNNTAMTNRQVVMTANPTLSIPGFFAGKNDDYYKTTLKTLRWPKGPDGKDVPLSVSVHLGFVPKDAKAPALAKDFVAFFLQPENLDRFVIASKGAFFPVRTAALSNEYFTKEDPHRSAVFRNFVDSPTLPYDWVYNRKMIQAFTENVWGRALGRIITDRWETGRAVDEMFARLKQLDAQ